MTLYAVMIWIRIILDASEDCECPLHLQLRDVNGDLESDDDTARWRRRRRRRCFHISSLIGRPIDVLGHLLPTCGAASAPLGNDVEHPEDARDSEDADDTESARAETNVPTAG